METLIENWFFVALILLCIGIHVFGYGHGHVGHGDTPTGEEAGE